MKKIIIVLISILMLSSLVLSSEIIKPKDDKYFIVEFKESNLNKVQLIDLGSKEIINVEVIDWNYERVAETKPQQVFYKTSEVPPADLSLSKPVYESPYDYEVLLKGKKKYLRMFVPAEYYETNTEKTTTSYLKAKVCYEESTPSFTPSVEYDPQMPYEYIIITNETFWDAFNEFAIWKVANDDKINDIQIINVSYIAGLAGFGVNSTFGDGTNTTGGNHWIPDGKEVTSNWELFNDTQAKIRNAIRFYYDTYTTRYVLLGGDDDYVPARMACSYAVGSCGFCQNWSNDTSHASDMYYSCLHYNMNNNTNSYWMENDCCGTTWDEIDWGHDIHVGRVLASSIEEVLNWVNKTKAYVEGNNQANGNYLDNFIVAGKDSGNSISNQTWTGWTGSYYGPNIGDEFSSNISFVNNQNISQAQWSIMNQYVNGTISGYDGIQFIYHNGHGGTLYSVDGGIFRPYQVNNTDTPTFVYTEGCNSGDFGTDNASRMERWMQFPECAFAGIANSAFGWFIASTYYGELFCQEMFNSSYGNFTQTFCEANELAKERYGHDADCVWGMIVKETNFFGDPALEYEWYSPTYSPQSSSIQFISIDGGSNMTNIYTLTPNFNWTSTENTSEYWLQIANDSAFTDLVKNITHICEAVYPSEYSIINNNISFTLPTALPYFGKQYYVRVIANVR